MDIATLGIVGAGTMGRGIALCAAQEGFRVILRSRQPIASVRQRLYSRLAGRREPPGAEDALESTLNRITITGDLRACASADLAIECVPEDFDTKAAVLRALDEGCPPETILASTTSSLSVQDLAQVTRRTERCIGLHFFNPADRMKLVEIVQLPTTYPQVIASVQSFLEALGKEVVVVQDTLGFVVNRLLLLLINEAMHMVEQGLGKPEDIDKAMRFGANFPMGPLQVADLIGLDTCLLVLGNLARALGPRYQPCALLSSLVRDGRLGRKSGQGFYPYAKA